MNQELVEAFSELRDTWETEFKRLNENSATKAELTELEEKAQKRLDEIDAAMQNGSWPSEAKTETDAHPFVELDEKLDWGYDAKSADFPLGTVRPGALFASMAFGEQVAQRLRDEEKATLLSSTGPAGGYTVPEALAGEFIAAVRPQAVAFRAGARAFPMRTGTVSLPGWDTPPEAAWRGEGGAFAEQTATFRKVTLTAKSVAAEIPLSIELLEDSFEGTLQELSDIVEAEFRRAIGQAIDKAAVTGAGTNNEPRGLYKADGVNITNKAAALSDYDDFLDMLYTVESNGFAANAAVYSPRVKRDLAKLTTGIAGDKTKLSVPEDVRALNRIVSNQIPEDLGAGSDETLIALGQWDRMVIGLRPSLGVRVQRDPYSQGSNGIVVLRAYARADVAVLDAGAFAITDQIL